MVWGRKSGTFMSAFLNVAVFTSNIPALLIGKFFGFTNQMNFCLEYLELFWSKIDVFRLRLYFESQENNNDSIPLSS